MTTDQDQIDQFIEPAEWQIRGSLRHGGITYGRGEPVPSMTLTEALQYERMSQLVRVNADGSVSDPKPTRPAPTTAEEYLRGRDEIVLRQILDFRPSKEMLWEMLVLTKRTGRTQYLRMTLEALCLYAGIEQPHADPH